MAVFIDKNEDDVNFIIALCREETLGRNNAPFEDALQRSGHHGLEAFGAIIDIWIREKEYDPGYDSAIRGWARTSREVADLVREVDRERIGLFKRIFCDLGYDDEEAEIRARVTYFHQVGYYTLGLQEPRAFRLKLAPLYQQVLVGRVAAEQR